jgi:hypothetical protein
MKKKENLWLYHFLFVVVPQKKSFYFFHYIVYAHKTSRISQQKKNMKAIKEYEMFFFSSSQAI